MKFRPARPVVRLGVDTRTDGGFSLVEVVVAIALISMVMGSVSLAFIRAMKAVDANQDRQAAVVVANQQMEFVRALPGKENILEGRTQADVQTLETDPRSFVFTDDVTAWDNLPAATDGGADDLVPLSKSVSVGRSAFLVRTYIRSCWRADATGTCVTQGSGTDGRRLLRVYVTVSWVPTAGGESCGGWTDPAGARYCEYVVAALLELNLEGDRLYK